MDKKNGIWLWKEMRSNNNRLFFFVCVCVCGGGDFLSPVSLAAELNL